jgi:hypothetical protein
MALWLAKTAVVALLPLCLEQFKINFLQLDNKTSDCQSSGTNPILSANKTGFVASRRRNLLIKFRAASFRN